MPVSELNLLKKLPSKIEVKKFYTNTLREGKTTLRIKNHLTWINAFLKKHKKDFILEPVNPKDDVCEVVKIKKIK